MVEARREREREREMKSESRAGGDLLAFTVFFFEALDPSAIAQTRSLFPQGSFSSSSLNLKHLFPSLPQLCIAPAVPRRSKHQNVQKHVQK